MGKRIGKFRLVLGIVVVGVSAVGCGGGDDGSGVYADRKPDDGNGGSGGLLDPDGGVQDPAAPIVTLLEPAPATDPNEDTVLTASTVTARCRVTKSEKPGAPDVDQSSVTMEVLGEGEGPLPITAAVDAVSEEEFEARFSFPDLPNGRVRFSCKAKGLVTNPLLGWDDVDTFLDLGPTIEMLKPEDKSIHALKSPVAVTFQVASAPLSDDDHEADLDSLEVVVSGQEFEAIESDDEPGFYSVLVDFGDRTIFPMPPSTAQIVVRATSERTPVAPERREVSNITLDSAGPTIKVTSPENFTLVRGEVTLTLNVADVSGVDPASIVATINDGVFVLSNWNKMGDAYAERFDTRKKETEELTQLSINVSARDNVGNETTISHFLLLDNLPPVLSLDPPLVRDSRKDGNVLLCSKLFDPLGAAISDEETSDTATLYRIAVYDDANRAKGSPIGYIAGVDETSVQLFLNEPDEPLLVDTNGDGKCDDVSQEGPNAPELNDDFQPLAPTGAAYFPPASDDDNPGPPPVGYTYGTETTEPDALCNESSDLTRVIPQPSVEGKPAAIYAWHVTSGFGCTGDAWTAGNIFPSGWVCAVARAKDKIGNIGVSPPIRVCYGGCEDAPPRCLGPEEEEEPCKPPDDWPSGLIVIP